MMTCTYLVLTPDNIKSVVILQVASNLKVLKIAGSKSLIKTPHFPKLLSLEILVLKDFLSLAEIDHSIGQLEQLTYLKIKWCPRVLESCPRKLVA